MGKYCSFQEASTVHTAAVSPLMQSDPSPAAAGSSSQEETAHLLLGEGCSNISPC